MPGYAGKRVHTYIQYSYATISRSNDRIQMKHQVKAFSKPEPETTFFFFFHAMGFNTSIMTFHNTLLNSQKCNEKGSRWSTGKYAPWQVVECCTCRREIQNVYIHQTIHVEHFVFPQITFAF